MTLEEGRRRVDAAQQIEPILAIIAMASAMESSADKLLCIDGREIRERAERRGGEILRALQAKGLIGGRHRAYQMADAP
jgi:hypothetical protein